MEWSKNRVGYRRQTRPRRLLFLKHSKSVWSPSRSSSTADSKAAQHPSDTLSGTAAQVLSCSASQIYFLIDAIYKCISR